ncbi:MAG: hypothetical protein IK107_04335 [Oscillospiraceae bacterium]|nr:hypothetical protein [Oscillospiraceae bacterium]
MAGNNQEKIKVVFLVGNGFDISCGLKVSYSDFYRWYLKQPAPNDKVDAMKKSIEKYMLEFGGKKYSSNSADTIQDQITWADFEMGLGEYTQNCSDAEAFEACYRDALKSLATYINKQAERFDVNGTPEPELERFADGIIHWTDDLRTGARNKIHIRSVSGVEYSFVSFNYTVILRDIINKVKELYYEKTGVSPFGEVINVHGYTDWLPIFGVSAEEQISNPQFKKNERITGFFIKRQCVENIAEDWYEKASQIIENSDVLCLFGTSIGSTDSIWWEKILYLLLKKPYMNVVLYTHSDPPDPIFSGDGIAKDKETRERLLRYGINISEEGKRELEKRIHIVYDQQSSAMKIKLASKKFEFDLSELLKEAEAAEEAEATDDSASIDSLFPVT